MKYITSDKLQTYLKLKKELALFIGLGQYFESKTFNWIRLSYANEQVKAVFVQSFDEGSETFNDVSKFSTVATLEKETGDESAVSASGDLETCLNWIKTEFDVDAAQFLQIQDLNELHSNLVAEGKLG